MQNQNYEKILLVNYYYYQSSECVFTAQTSAWYYELQHTTYNYNSTV